MSNQLALSYLKSTKIQNGRELRTLSDCLRHHASIRPNENAFVFVSADGGRETITWKLLHDKSASAARGFLQLGVRRHEFVAVNVRCCPDWLYIHYGIIMAGARAANISFTYTDGSDVIAMMKKLGTCSTMVLDAGVDEDNWGIFQTLIDEHFSDGTVKSAVMPYLSHLILLDHPRNTTNVKTFRELSTDIASGVVLPDMNEDDIVSLFQSSGSTGLPKLIAHTHASLTEFCKSFMSQQYRVFYNDRPFSWLGGYPSNIAWGTTRVLRSGIGPEPDYMPAFVASVIRKERCSLLFSLSSQLHQIADRKDVTGADWPLQAVMTGGQPITEDTVKWAGSLCQMSICVYGSTECGMISTFEVKDAEHFEKYSCGDLVPNCEVKIEDENGELVPVGMRGEVYVRCTGGMFREYWNDPQKTESVLSADGWFRTDDIGRLSKEGTLFVEGRKSDMIISGGMNVNPAILETAINTCPDVYSVMAVPISHPVLYQVVCACVVPVTGRFITEDALRRFCESIHNDKPGLFTVLPRYYLIMEEFPETSNGKISRKYLAAIAEKLLKG